MLKSHIGSTTIALALFLVASAAEATTYYVDASKGADSNNGQDTTKAWKTLAKVQATKLGPGDSVCLKRGGVWTESLYLKYSGTAKSPIVITCYGPASLPLPQVTTSGEIFQVQTGSHMVIEKLFLTGGKWSGVEIADTTSSDITIQDLEISRCGGGLYLAGTGITARRNYIHDGKMVVNTQGAAGSSQANDDYGATGINMGQINGCSVYENRLVNLRAPSYDYGYDGGSFEFFRSVRNCEIARNFSYNVDGFAELGGSKGDSMVNISIHNNVTFEAGNFVCFHLYDATGATAYGVGFKGVTMDNNLQITRLRDPSFILLADGSRLKDSTLIQIRNNIFASDTLSGGLVYEAGAPSNKSSYVHSHNLVWCTASRNPFASREKPGPGDVFANPQFVDSLWDKAGSYDSTVAGYWLRSSSPAVGTGLAVPTDTVNYLGRLKVVGGGGVNLGPLPVQPAAIRNTASNRAARVPAGFGIHRGYSGPAFDALGERLPDRRNGVRAWFSVDFPSEAAGPDDRSGK